MRAAAIPGYLSQRRRMILESDGSDAIPDLKTLDLKFTTGALDPRITFTRASSATYFDGNGRLSIAGTNQPRFDYDPATLECKGLLIEEARTNLLLNSETLSTQDVTTTNVAHTLSFYGTGTITLTGTSTAGPLVGTGTSNRVSLTFTPTAGTLTVTVSGTVSKAQLEVGAFSTSYIPTTSSTATRDADVTSITGTNFSSWFNASEGTFFIEINNKIVDKQRHMFSAYADSTNRLTVLVGSANYMDAQSVVGGTDTLTIIHAPLITSLSSEIRSAFAYKTDDSNFATNLGDITATELGAIPTGIVGLSIGCSSASVSQLNGHIKRFTYYNTRLPNATLVTMTT